MQSIEQFISCVRQAGSFGEVFSCLVTTSVAENSIFFHRHKKFIFMKISNLDKVNPEQFTSFHVESLCEILLQLWYLQYQQALSQSSSHELKHKLSTYKSFLLDFSGKLEDIIDFSNSNQKHEYSLSLWKKFIIKFIELGENLENTANYSQRKNLRLKPMKSLLENYEFISIVTFILGIIIAIIFIILGVFK
jgi:hypothetical protein